MKTDLYVNIGLLINIDHMSYTTSDFHSKKFDTAALQIKKNKNAENCLIVCMALRMVCNLIDRSTDSPIRQTVSLGTVIEPLGFKVHSSKQANEASNLMKREGFK